MTEDIQRTVDSVLQLWNTGSVEAAERLYSNNSQRSDPYQPTPARGAGEISQFVGAVRRGFPDFKLEIKRRILEGNQLVLHWTCTGTHKGEFQGIPPTGKQVDVSGLTLMRIEKDRIAEEQVYFDRLALLEQLGAVPAMAQAQAKQAAR